MVTTLPRPYHPNLDYYHGHIFSNFMIILFRELSPKLGDLTSLKDFDIETNSFIGTLSSELGNLRALTELYLYNNQFTGPIPTELVQPNGVGLTQPLWHVSYWESPIRAWKCEITGLSLCLCLQQPTYWFNSNQVFVIILFWELSQQRLEVWKRWIKPIYRYRAIWAGEFEQTDNTLASR